MDSLGPEEAYSPNEITVAIRKYGQRYRIPEHLLMSVEVARQPDLLLDEIMIDFRAFVLSDRIVDRLYSGEVRVPANPWQHLKQRFAPAWFLRRWPVETSSMTLTIEMNVDALYPEARVHFNERLGPVRFHENAELLPWEAPRAVSQVRATKPTYREILREAGRKVSPPGYPDPRGWS